MQVLFVTSECYPLVKTGGLADVSGALPKALQSLEAFSGSVKVLLPGYPVVLENIGSLTPLAQIDVLGQPCQLMLGTLPLCRMAA